MPLARPEGDVFMVGKSKPDKVRNMYVVGIGASAGRLESLEQLFDHMPYDAGMSFVVVQYLSSNLKSFMAELLSRHTPMNVYQAKHKMPIEPNSVYLVPPNKRLTISSGRLLIGESAAENGMPLPIDGFFQSLADDFGGRAVGIILSGAGSDGAHGIEAIKKAGGIVLVQDERTAEYDAMPGSASMTDKADHVLAPEHMGEVLLAHVRSGANPAADSEAHKEPPFAREASEFAYLLHCLKKGTGIDFSHYKQSSVMRRVERRLGLYNMPDLRSYIRYMEENPSEIGLLQKDLLIGTTHFFRDAQAFETLKQNVLPLVFKNKGEDKEIRIWVAGCSTGEEAYTLAILLHEVMEKLDEPFSAKIFATDLDKESIDFASQGIYPERLVSGLPPELLKRYFVNIHDAYHVRKDIRKMVVFAQHNILKDPPFINLDVISCRNMLIYFQAEMQRKVLSLFHFALNPNGFLFLGPSETIGKLSNLFSMFDPKWNIFRHKESRRSLLPGTFGFGDTSPTGVTVRHGKYAKPEESKAPSPVDMIMRELIREYVPPCIIIDEHNEIIHSHGDVNEFLSLPQGKPSHNVLKLVFPSLSAAVGSAIHKVRREKCEVVYRNVKLLDKGGLQVLNLRVKPCAPDAAWDYVVLFFEKAEAKADCCEVEANFAASSDVTKRIADLEQELQHAEEYLQATIEELETSNEELQVTNEELLAANEELQSANEELQSLNEELISVNNEYQLKIQELTQLNNDMDNLLVSTKIGTVFLDKKMCVRRFTPSIVEEINLLEVDIGRPLAHISHHFKYDSLVKDAQQVLQDSVPVEKEIQSKNGKWYMMRILPYRFNDTFVEGVVITFVDITDLKSANEELCLLSRAIQQSPSIIVIADPKGMIGYVNPKFSEITGYTFCEAVGKHLQWLSRLDPAASVPIWGKAASGEKWEGELENVTKDGRRYWEYVSVVPIKNQDGDIIHYLWFSLDNSERKNAEEMLRRTEMLSAIGQLAAGIAHEIRNPLTALKGFTKLLRASGKDSRYTEIMSGELDRIESIIGELLLLAKPQALQFQDKDLLVILREVILLLDTQAIMSGVEIVTSFALESGVVRCVDRQLKQVFINILKNAIEAMPEGGRITVHVALSSPGMLSVSFADQGCGIPEEHLPHLGQPFYTTKEKGTGLGLMMTYKIIEDHGGGMSIDSKVGEGTTVTVELPVSDMQR